VKLTPELFVSQMPASRRTNNDETCQEKKKLFKLFVQHGGGFFLHLCLKFNTDQLVKKPNLILH
jgi:hypothetical protein